MSYTGANTPNAYCKVVLRLNCSTNLNQKVGLVGGITALGSWKQENALRMNTDQGSYPIWSVTFSVSQQESQKPIEYKYIKLTTLN